MPTLSGSLQMSSVRLEEGQLVELSLQARKHPVRQGFLVKVDHKGKKTVQKWILLYRNFLFCFDSEISSKPSCVIIVESCICSPIDTDLPDCPMRDRECAFSISYQKDSSSKQFVFFARSVTDRNEWITAINNSSMMRVQQEYDLLCRQYHQLESQLSSSLQEVCYLKQQHLDSQEDLAQLRATLTIPHRKSSSFSVPRTPTPEPDNEREESARILQKYIRGWLIRRRWKHVVHAYMKSPHAELMRKRNQLIWKFVASEEDYVSQLTLLNSEFQRQFEIAACSHKPPLSMIQSVDIFRNCNELLLFHQLFLRGLHNRIEKWPVVNLGDIFKLFIPMLSVYHQYVGNHTHSLDVLFELKLSPHFKEFLKSVEGRPMCNQCKLEDLLILPLKGISRYILDLQELKAHTPVEHVDYPALSDMVAELEIIQKTVTDEVSLSENIRQVLKVESKIEGGCEVLLDKEQALVRKGFLSLYRQEDKDKGLSFTRKTRRRHNYCFLFSKHLIITQRVEKKGEEGYKLVKEFGILPLAKCRIHEHPHPDCAELRFLGFTVDYEHSDDKHTVILIAMGVAEKAQWIADIAQCIESEKQNKILRSQSLGEPVELSSKFIRYSTFKSGKEQLVNCGNLDSLLQRLTKVSYFGLDFLNTFLTTFPIFTTAHVVLDFLIKSYHEYIEIRGKKAISSKLPEDCVKEARSHALSPDSASNRSTMPGVKIKCATPTRSYSNSQNTTGLVSGIFFALKHWICKHFYHFRECNELDVKLQELLDIACNETQLSCAEKRVILEVSRLYTMQKACHVSTSQYPILQYISTKEETPSFDIVLTWQPRQVAEQLCLIDSALFCQIENNELLRHMRHKGENKVEVAPNLVTMIQHFNRMSVFWMWTVAKQHNEMNRCAAIEFLISLGMECYQLNNFMSMMQVLGALEHSSVLKFNSCFDLLSKTAKMHHKMLQKLGSIDGRYKELKAAVRKAQPPLLPYLALTMNDLICVSEGAPTYLEGNLINFTKMRRYTRIIHSVLQHQKDPYEFPIIPEISKILLSTELPGDESVLYEYVDQIIDKPSPPPYASP